MTELDLSVEWAQNAQSRFIIPGLILLNIILAIFAFLQKRRRNKLERDILALKTFGSKSFLESKHAVSEPAELKKNMLNSTSRDVTLLKIDQAIRMLQSGSSLDEIKSTLDIEASYVKILAKHYQSG